MEKSKPTDRNERLAIIIERITQAPDTELDDIDTLFRSQDNLKELKKWHQKNNE